MAINKVEFGDQTLIDLTGDTVTEDDVLNGKSFHDKSGALRSGTASYPVTDVQVNNTSVLDGTVAKITQGTAATKDVPASGNASASQVVMGNDTRLTDSRNAKDVYAWAKASSKPSYTASEVGAIATSAKGANGGVAELDSTGKVPSSQLPSFVDDVLEYDSLSNFPTTGETGKIYIAKDTNKTYRWSGTAYAEISASLALGETSSTAYRGDRGKTAYNHSQVTSGNPHNVTKSDVGLGNVGNFKAVSTVASQGLTDTEKSNARTNIGAGTSSFSGSYNDLTDKPTIPTVNNATLTIQKNGTTVKTFTANASSNVTANITVPVKTSDLTNDSNFVADSPTFTEASSRANIVSGETFTTILGKIKKFFTDLKTVAFTGSYNDLTNKPTIPTVNNATLTIQKNGTTVKTFTANASSNVTANITVPTKVSELTNDSGYVTTNTTYTFATGDSNGQIKVTPSGGSAQNVSVKGLGSAAYKNESGTWAINVSGSSASCTGNAATATKATQDGSGNNIVNTYVPLKTNGGISVIGGNGSYSWCRIATLTTSNYCNGPVTFEVSQRQEPVSLVQVGFKSVGSGADPGLSYFTTNYSSRYYIKKTATSTWELYCNYTEKWGALSLHRVFGYRYNSGVNVTIDMVNIEDPTDVTQVSFGGNVGYADNSGTVNGKTVAVNVPADAVFTDTKNTAGSTDSSSKLFLIGATSQAANPQTYSHDTAYVGTDGCLYSGGTKVLTAHQSLDPIKHTNTDIPEGAANLSATATAHKITAYRNGLTIPYQMDNVNDGGMLRVRGTSENNCILELGTWDDSGAGETIQFNYYPTTSQVTPTYSVSVPKKSGTIALTSDISGKVDKSGDTMSGVLKSSYKSGTWVNSLTNSAIALEDSAGSFGGWICGPTKNGRIVLSTYQSNDDKLYLGYGERGRTDNSYAKQACWNGATGKWECDITGNAATATKATQDGSGNVITSTYLPTSGGTMTGNLNIGSNGAGGYLNGSATNGGVNSIRVGDDVWLGDCNVGGILGMKSTGANCGFKFFNSSGTDIGVLQSTAGKLQFNGSNICMASDFSGSVSAAVNATTCTISDSRITTSSTLEPFSSNSKGNVITVTKMVVSAGKVVLTFPALSDATSFKVRITN